MSSDMTCLKELLPQHLKCTIEENPFLLVCAKDWNHFHSIMSEDHLEEFSAMFVTNPVMYEKILNDDAKKNPVDRFD